MPLGPGGSATPIGLRPSRSCATRPFVRENLVGRDAIGHSHDVLMSGVVYELTIGCGVAPRPAGYGLRTTRASRRWAPGGSCGSRTAAGSSSQVPVSFGGVPVVRRSGRRLGDVGNRLVALMMRVRARVDRPRGRVDVRRASPAARGAGP